MRSRPGIASFPPVIGTNPYQRLLYEHLIPHDLYLVPRSRLSFGMLIRERHRVGVLHFHWPQGCYQQPRGPRWVRVLLSWPRIALFAVRLLVARALSYRVMWTVHQVIPHEPLSRYVDIAGARVLAAASNVLIVHDKATERSGRALLGRSGRRISVLAHGSYIGAYPPGRDRSAVREALDIPASAFVVLAFGMIRAYKGSSLLLDAFQRADIEDAVLIFAGPALGAAAAPIEAAARQDPRIRTLLGYVEDEDVTGLFAAADVAAISRHDGGTSGAIILAMSMGVPVVTARLPAYEDLLGGGSAGWLFEPGDSAAFAAALVAARTDPLAAERGREALRRAEGLRWDETASGIAGLLGPSRARARPSG